MVAVYVAYALVRTIMGRRFKETDTKVLGFVLEKNSVPTELDEFREHSDEFRTSFDEFSECEA